MASADELLPPVFDRPPHLEHAAGLRVWFVEPLGVVTQLARPLHATLEVGRFLSETMDPVLHAKKQTLDEKLFYIHDWRNLVGYTTETRKHLTDWGIAVRRDIRELVVVLGEQTPKMTKMAIHVAASSLSLVGVNLKLADDIHTTVQRLGLKPRTD